MKHRKHVRERVDLIMFFEKYISDHSLVLILLGLLLLVVLLIIIPATGYFQTGAVYTLTQMLEDKGNREHVPIASAQVIGTISDERAVEPLIAALADENPEVREAAAESLQLLVEAGEPAVEPLIAALDSKKPETQKKATELNMDDKGVGNLLITAIDEDNLLLVAKAHLYYIRRGKQGTEEILIEALEQHGWKRMAENYLNSGNLLLEEAAREWAARHGYRVVSRAGESVVSWGN